MREQRTVSVNGIQINYTTYGEPGSPAIILLHALGVDSSDWHGATALASTHHVYVPDMRGHGQSEWPGEYSFELMRDDVLALVEALDIRQATLVGHSMGGTVSWLVAQQRPDWLTHLVIEDSPMPRPGWRRRELRPRPDGELPFDWAVIEAIVAELNDPNPTWWDDIEQVEAPTLLIAGGPESHVPQDLIADAAELLANSKLITIVAGHHIHRNRPDDFLSAVRTFLAD